MNDNYHLITTVVLKKDSHHNQKNKEWTIALIPTLSRPELYGYVTSTKEWKNHKASVTTQTQGYMTGTKGMGRHKVTNSQSKPS